MVLGGFPSRGLGSRLQPHNWRSHGGHNAWCLTQRLGSCPAEQRRDEDKKMAFLTAKQERLRVDVGELKEMGTLESFGIIRVSKSLHGGAIIRFIYNTI